MKPKNFPARKKTRQIQAAIRAEKPEGRRYRDLTKDEQFDIEQARRVRTKKNRGGA